MRIKAMACLIGLLFLMSLMPASAMTFGTATVGSTFAVSSLPDGAVVQFVLNGGAPVFAAVNNGTALYMPLLIGTLNIVVTQNNVIIASQSTTVLPAASPAPSGRGGGGGSGGGGGVTSPESFANIEKADSKDMNIAKGPVSIKFSKVNIVNEIGFDAKTNQGWVTARVEQLKGRPTLATSDAPGTVYKYFNVWLGTAGYADSSKIANTYVKFSVPSDWVTGNNIQTVKLMKLVNNTWVDLNTQKADATTYKAETLGFCSFAIVGTQAQAAVTTPITPGVTSAPTAAPGAPGTGGAASASYSSAPHVNFALAIGVIIIIAIVVVIYLKRK